MRRFWLATDYFDKSVYEKIVKDVGKITNSTILEIVGTIAPSFIP